MRIQKAILFLINFMMGCQALAEALPSWVNGGALSDAKYFYVICSHEGVDPEDARQVAESKCLSSAAKLGGVTVNVRSKTVQSLTGADSSEVAEILPQTKNVRCEWLERYMEKLDQGYRIWLQCRVSKSSLAKNESESIVEQGKTESVGVASVPYKRGLLTLTISPQADRVIVVGPRGERVIEVSTKLVKIELREGEDSVIVRKHRYKDARIPLSEWHHGQTISHKIFLELDGV